MTRDATKTNISLITSDCRILRRSNIYPDCSRIWWLGEAWNVSLSNLCFSFNSAVGLLGEIIKSLAYRRSRGIHFTFALKKAIPVPANKAHPKVIRNFYLTSGRRRGEINFIS